MDLETVGTFGRAMIRTLRDSNEIEALMVIEDICSVGHIGTQLDMVRASEEGRALLAERPRIDSHMIARDELDSLPRGTLGREYVEHMRRWKLDPDVLTAACTRGTSPAARYMIERLRQTHDIWHVVLDLGADSHEEVLLHTFQWSQLHRPYSALILFFGGIKHFIGEARFELLRGAVPGGFQAGRDASPLLPVYWERHWSEPLTSVRERLGVRPSDQWG